MLPSQERLRRASVFQRAYNKRMVVSTSIVTMYVLPKEGRSVGRGDWKPLTGFVVAKKVSKSAVKRNRAKRRIREVYRLLRTSIFSGERQDIALRDWYAIVFVAQEPALEATYQQIEDAVVSCLVRASSKNRKDRQNPEQAGKSTGQRFQPQQSQRTVHDGQRASRGDKRDKGSGFGPGQADTRQSQLGQTRPSSERKPKPASIHQQDKNPAVKPPESKS